MNIPSSCFPVSKKLFSVVLSAGMLLAFCSADAATPVTFWVATNGSDAAAGTKANPFLTLERARDAVRTVLAAQSADITVNIRGGTYRLDQTLELEAQDSGHNGFDVVYRSAPGETAVLSGSVPVTGWSLYDPAKRIYRANVGAYKSRQLYVKGTRAPRARTSDYPAGFRPSPDNGIEFIPTTLNPAGWRDPSTWTNPDRVEAVCVTQWKMTRVRVASVTSYPNFTPPSGPVTGLLVMQSPGWANANVFLERDPNDEFLPAPPADQPGTAAFWQVTYFENAYQFLDEAREWYLDETTGWLYYIPHWTEDMAKVPVELPILEVLVEGIGDKDNPVTNIRFEGLTFCNATWMDPSTGDGYVTDQSGFHLTGSNPTNIIDHNLHDVRTPGNVQFEFAHNITFTGNIFEHLGAVALDFAVGSQENRIESNLFEDISSAAIQIGGVEVVDHHPDFPEQITRDNVIHNNLIHKTGREYTDAAGIFLGFTTRTLVSNNTIVDVPWAAVAIGWGWGLVDPTGFPGIPGAHWYEWGTYATPTTNLGCEVVNNRMYNFLNVMWDGGAVYTTGAQGTSPEDALLLEGNVATGKRPKGGGNIFYTDGGSRYITLRGNISMRNAQGVADFGPAPSPFDPLPYHSGPSALTGFPYGTDIGGCRTYGDIVYEGNYWVSTQIGVVCPYTYASITYPKDITYLNNHQIRPPAKVPASIVNGAGVRKRPSTIPAARWNAVKVD